MMADSTVQVQVSHAFSQSPVRVYDAWLDPTTAGKWLFATETGEMVKVQIDARVGGRFCLTDLRDGVEVDHVGVYMELDRPARLVFTFAVPMYSKLYTQVTIDVEPTPVGCDLTLTHQGVLAEYGERTKSGWTTILDKLAKLLD